MYTGNIKVTVMPSSILSAPCALLSGRVEQSLRSRIDLRLGSCLSELLLYWPTASYSCWRKAHWVNKKLSGTAKRFEIAKMKSINGNCKSKCRCQTAAHLCFTPVCYSAGGTGNITYCTVRYISCSLCAIFQLLGVTSIQVRLMCNIPSLQNV